ncbi:CAP-Gly domain-containing linker protein 2-like [Spea bombifrons]|uniref:CAP-Gly domain-containing linker protein 2-like n=1 Tax=Spea bombifrons TaxID=233779 RepID=UPI00234B5556|nr:CAP-Gly domain-containing linker protein 2-like [Spea bombifrons]
MRKSSVLHKGIYQRSIEGPTEGKTDRLIQDRRHLCMWFGIRPNLNSSMFFESPPTQHYLTQTQLEHARIRELEQNLLFEKAKTAKLLKELEDKRLTTVAEQSRIQQLEEERSLRRNEIEDLQHCLLNSSQTDIPEHSLELQTEALRLRDQLLSASKEHQKESSQQKDTYEKNMKKYQQEIEKLNGLNEKHVQEIADLRKKLELATRENMGMMDSWKSKLDSIVSDHQKSLHDLKGSLVTSPDTQYKEVVDLKANMESLKMEHQLELENLKAKNEIEIAVRIKEKEILKSKIQEIKDEIEGGNNNWKTQLESKTNQHLKELQDIKDKYRATEQRVCELEKINIEYNDQTQAIAFMKEQISIAKKKIVDYDSLQKADLRNKQEIQRLQDNILLLENKLQSMEQLLSSQNANVIETNDISEEKIKMKNALEDLQVKLSKRDKEVSSMSSHIEALRAQITALENRCKSGDKKVDSLVKDNKKLEAELEAFSRKSHDTSGQFVLISQDLLKKERNLNELRALLLEANRRSPGPEKDLSREVHKADWRSKEQKLKEEIKILREKLMILDKEKSVSDQRRYSLIDPSTESEVLRLQHRLVSTEDALRVALDQGHQMEKLMEAMRNNTEKSQVTGNSESANGIHQQEKSYTQEENP